MHKIASQPAPLHELEPTAAVTFELPADAADSFQPLLEHALLTLQATEPDLTLADLRLGALTEAAGPLAVGTPVVQAATAAGSRLLTATPAPELAVSGNYTPKSPMLGNPMLLALGKQLGMALGKMMLKKVDPALYKLCFGESTDEIVRRELGNLKEELQSFLLELRQEDLQNEFLKVRGWLRDTYGVKLAAYEKMAAQARTPDDRAELERLAKDVYDTLNGYQQRMQELAEVIEVRLSDAELAGCGYQVRLKVELHRLAFMQRLVLLAAQIHWRRLRNGGRPVPDLEDDFRSYAEARLQAARRLTNALQQARYGCISQPYHLNYFQYQDETGRGGLSFASHWYGWRDDFESAHAHDPFRGARIRDYVEYLQELKLPWPAPQPKNQGIANAQAQKRRDAHFHDVDALFQTHVRGPFEEAEASINTSLNDLAALSA